MLVYGMRRIFARVTLTPLRVQQYRTATTKGRYCRKLFASFSSFFLKKQNQEKCEMFTESGTLMEG